MRLIPIALLAAASALHAQAPAPAGDAWKKIDFLLGEWTATATEKDTAMGSGQGSFSFKGELKQRLIVRRNIAQYDSGQQHDDLMVIYLDSPNNAPRAIYWDTEGHVIRYNLAFPAANRVVFESDGTQPGPKYRLSYWMEGASLNGRFEIAPPGSGYKAYLNWSSHKR